MTRLRVVLLTAATVLVLLPSSNAGAAGCGEHIGDEVISADSLISDVPVGALSEQPHHKFLTLIVNSRPIGEPRYKDYGELVVRYVDEAGQTIDKTARGRYWYGEYEVMDAAGERDTGVTGIEMLQAYTACAIFSDGAIRLQSKTRLIFNVDETWVSLWVAALGGYYTLGVVDEQH